jgi:regulator of sigma E protease
VLVFIHEAGHFVAAKWAGIYVHRFSLGLGSPIRWLTFRRGETEYSVSWIPLGGYVKMASGEEDIGSSPLEGGRPPVEVPRDRMFESKPLWKRMIVILAGVTMNALFAWFLFTFLAAKNGRQIDPATSVGRVVPELVPAGAEALKTLRPGSVIVAINGRRVSSWNEIEQGIIDASEPSVRLELADGGSVEVPLHPDALEARLKASQAIQPFRAAVIGEVLPGRPAARAGLAKGDTILAVDGQPIGQWYDLLEILRRDPGKALTFEVARGARHLTLSINPEVDTITDTDGKVRPVWRWRPIFDRKPSPSRRR